MNLKKVLSIVLLSFLLLCATVVLASCGGEDVPQETQGVTDAVTEAEQATQGETEAVTDAPVMVSCVFTVKDQDGNLMSGVTFALKQSGVQIREATTDAKGQATMDVPVGSYVATFTVLPDQYTADDVAIELTEQTTTMDLAIKNTTPNGEADRPFVITQDATEIKLPANSSVYYIFYGGMNRYMYIENTTATITYKDETYSPNEDGNIKVDLVTEGPRDPITFALNNTTDAELTLTLLVQAVLGSMERPVEIAELNTEVTAVVPKESTIYHKWVATMDGVLMVSSANELNNITLTNLRNSAASYFTDGSACEYIAVKTGDEVMIAVGSKDSNNQTEIAFSLSAFAGDKTAPIVLGKDKVTFHFDADATWTYSYTPADNTAKVIEVNGTDVVLVIEGNETTYTPNEEGVISVTLTEGTTEAIVFTITNNNADEGCEVVIEILDKKA